jgi:two-component system, cell cycle response regulator
MTEDGPLSSHTTVEYRLDDMPAKGEKKPFLYVLAGSLVGRKYPLTESCSSVGRSSKCTICVSDNQISRQHFEILLEGGAAVVRDLGSKNGTFVNGVKRDMSPLKDGDKIQISAATIMKFSYQDVTESHFHDKLYSMATRDPVTNAYNRGHFLTQFAQAYEQTFVDESALSMLMLDLDHFKRVNDTFGHLAGDLALQRVARALLGELRSDDLLARYGGEEFAALLRDADEDAALAIAERMRVAVAETKLKYQESEFQVTISIGVATHTVRDPFPDIDSIIREADGCLYASKERGRNRVTTPTDLMEETVVGDAQETPDQEE